VLAGLALNAVAGLLWADPAAACVIIYYTAREARDTSGAQAGLGRPRCAPLGRAEQALPALGVSTSLIDQALRIRRRGRRWLLLPHGY